MPRRLIKPRMIIKPFEDFFKHEAAGGFLLVIFALIALIWANSSWAGSYEAMLDLHITLGYGKFALSKSLLHWINDGLMAIFFFVVGMEIKRELVGGELASLKKAALPVGAAVGGMIVPAVLFILFNGGTENASGWGVPMATDIAFALGALSMLNSKKVPGSLRVFLAALAIVDDIGAVLVIAIFYTAQLAWIPLLCALGLLLALILANKLKCQTTVVFVALGFLLWLAVLESGVHATIAGVLLGMTIPRPMLERLEHALQDWVAFFIMPIFALANAGVAVDFGSIGKTLTSPVGLGIIAGLFVGKQVGIFGASYLMVRLKLAALPRHVRWIQLYGVSLLGGIGFTMSMFITNLAFRGDSALTAAKISIIAASMLSAVTGVGVLSQMSKQVKTTRNAV